MISDFVISVISAKVYEISEVSDPSIIVILFYQEFFLFIIMNSWFYALYLGIVTSKQFNKDTFRRVICQLIIVLILTISFNSAKGPILYYMVELSCRRYTENHCSLGYQARS